MEEPVKSDQTVTSRVKSASKEVGNEVKTATRRASSEITAEAKQAVDGVKQNVKETVEQGKSQVASQIGGVASALYEASGTLENESHSGAAQYTQQLGQQVDKVASYLDDRSPRDLLVDLEDFAKRHPAIFLGGSFLVGISLARFLKSSARDA